MIKIFLIHLSKACKQIYFLLSELHIFCNNLLDFLVQYQKIGWKSSEFFLVLKLDCGMYFCGFTY